MKLFEELKWRGLIETISSDKLVDEINNGSLTFYIGTDPTADSLHIGHYSSLLMAERLRRWGHKPIILVGGATGLIGDPKPNTERPMITKQQLDHNYEMIQKQVKRLFEFEFVNNYDWSKDINFIDYLRDYGKHFSINYMLNKETVKARLDIGITYTEFSYMIMQALDFLYLYENNNCTLQIGGTDQWGNITSGIELIRRKIGKEAFGFTMPLITKADGTKFGKTESGTVWLDKDKTSSYELYQYFINVEDEMVIDYLKKLTFKTKDEIEVLEKSLTENPHLREAHKALASEVIKQIHGEEELNKALKITEVLFSGNIKSLSKEELEIAFKDVPSFEFEDNISFVNLLIEGSIATSKREAREFISSGSISLNGEKYDDLELVISKDMLINEELLVIRKGKKKYYLAKIKKEI
jgi:tyrosyl-tRNA synthetase